MRPPTEVERLAVFLAAMAVTRALLPRTKPQEPRPPAYNPLAADQYREALLKYRARYGANNPGAN